MVTLLSKSEIQSFNVDTVEKALVFAALALRAALVGSDNAHADNLAVSINVSAISDSQGSLNLEIYLPYSAYQLNTNAGQLLDAVLEYDSNSPSLNTDLNLESQATSSGLTLPDYDPVVVNTFEKYLVYYAQILWASVANKRGNAISITFLGNQDNPQVWLSLNLPLNLNQWLLGDSYLDALGTVVTEYVTSTYQELDPSLFTRSNSYYLSLDSPSTFALESVLVVSQPAILDRISIEVYYDFEAGSFDAYFYLNGNPIDYQEFYDYGDDTFDIIFDTDANQILLSPGDELEIEINDDAEPIQVDLNIFTYELS